MTEDPNPSGMSMDQLADVSDELAGMLEASKSRRHIRVSHTDDDSILIEGNTAGLTALAWELLGVAMCRKQGLHSHLDRLTLFSESETDYELIVQYGVEPEK